MHGKRATSLEASEFQNPAMPMFAGHGSESKEILYRRIGIAQLPAVVFDPRVMERGFVPVPFLVIRYRAAGVHVCSS
jgi:hypothetical protein